MERVKAKIIALWLHIWLKRIARKYPDFFVKMLNDLDLSDKCIKIMKLRYIDKKKFKEIPELVHTEERMKLHNDMRKGSQMLVERIEKIAKEQDKFSWQEFMYMADIMKDLSEVEKNLAKACHYGKDMPEL